MNVLSLFTGIGGIDLGLQRAGMTIAGQVEIDPWCRTILAKHWPEVPRHDDVRTAAGWWGSRPVDLVAGGTPCQPVSIAGKKLGTEDDRWLWPSFFGIVRHARPRWVLLENVPGILARGLGDVLRDLASIGYDAEWDCIPAAFVGAPHVRRRVFVVAYSEGQRGQLRPAPAERPGRPASSRPDVALAGSGRHRPPQPLVFTGRHSPVDRSRWPAEPDVGRLAYGVPRRVDRLRGLGNAVVPQVAEHIGRLILEAVAA